MSAIPTNRSPDAVRAAIAVFGDQKTMGLAIDVEQPTISEWATGKRPVPVRRCPTIERMTRVLGSVVTCERLRPDVDWAEMRAEMAK